MKKLTLTAFLLFSLVSLPAQNPDPNPAKTKAKELSEELSTRCKEGEPTQETWSALCTKIDGYQTEFGVTPATTNNIIILRKFQLRLCQKFPDLAKFTALNQKLQTDPIPEIAQLAQNNLAMMQRLEDLKTKPMELKFTDLGGKEIDLLQYRGKAVIIQFWAQWCPDCRESAPKLAALQEKHRSKGLEIIGISLDSDKNQLQDFIRKNNMTWPQYFDGKKWDNSISRSYNISSIPAYWLLNREGLLVSKTKDLDELETIVNKSLSP